MESNVSNLDDVLNGNADELLNEQAEQAQQEQHADAGTEGDEQHEHQEQPTGEEGRKSEESPAEAEKKDAPPASETDHHVPRRALEDERRKRQQLEQELAQLRQARPPQPQQYEQQEPLAPEAIMQQQLFNERLNMSEMILRQRHEDVDTVIERFQQEAQKNPALGAQLQSQSHPYQWAYDYAKRLMVMDEIGSDPEAYKTQLREQLMAELQQQQQAQESTPPPAEKPNLPKSLAGARSAAGRTAPTWTGPTPLDDILKQ